MEGETVKIIVTDRYKVVVRENGEDHIIKRADVVWMPGCPQVFANVEADKPSFPARALRGGDGIPR